jgi:cell division protein FtsB
VIVYAVATARRNDVMKTNQSNNTESRWLTQAQLALGWAIVLLLLGSVGALYLGQASQAALIGREAEFLESDLETLQDENLELEQHIAEAQSVSALEARARDMGLNFIRPKPDEIEYIDETVFIAPSAPVTLQPENESTAAATLPDTVGEALLILVQNNFSQLFEGESRANR